MANVNIEGRYTITGEHLIRQTDRQLLHIQRNICKPKKGAKRHPAELLILIGPNGQRNRISGLFRVNTTIQGKATYSFDYEGQNYRLIVSDQQTAVIQRGKTKGKQMVSVSPNQTASSHTPPVVSGPSSTSSTPHQLQLWG